ncbi:MAG: preprotein translocase subunit SecG [Paraprevotella sp.]|nr:preprotein translocase subunit SecG [Paraprevotella sp.]
MMTTMSIMLFAVILMAAVLVVLFAVVMMSGTYKESKLDKDLFASSTSMWFGKGYVRTGATC